MKEHTDTDAAQILSAERTWAVPLKRPADTACESSPPSGVVEEPKRIVVLGGCRGTKEDPEARPNPKAQGVREYWARMTPEQRSAEIRRRKEVTRGRNELRAQGVAATEREQRAFADATRKPAPSPKVTQGGPADRTDWPDPTSRACGTQDPSDRVEEALTQGMPNLLVSLWLEEEEKRLEGELEYARAEQVRAAGALNYVRERLVELKTEITKSPK